MSEMEKTVETGTDEFEALLPEGWAEGDDIFDEGSWSGSASAEDPDQEDSSEETNTDPTDPAPTTEPEADESGAADDASASSAKKFRVPVKINHESSEVEISEADLPALYQKAMAFDRGQEKSQKMSTFYQNAERTARNMGYKSAEEMLESANTTYRQAEIDRLVDDGVQIDMATDFVDRRLNSGRTEPEQAPDSAEQSVSQGEPQSRDWKSEVADLMRVRPNLRESGLPDAVQEKATKENVPLLVAYLEYESEQQKAEIQRLTKTNKTHEQNAASAARAPVKGVSGGGATDTSPSDAFLEGFNSDGW